MTCNHKQAENTLKYCHSRDDIRDLTCFDLPNLAGAVGPPDLTLGYVSQALFCLIFFRVPIEESLQLLSK